MYDLDVYETHLTTLYTYIKFSAFLYPSYVHVLPIAKRHCGIFLCHSILHVALHKHFVLTNGHVFFFLDNFNSRLFVYYKILLLFYLYRTGFFSFFFNMDKKFVSMARYMYEMVSSALGLLVQEIQQCHS